MIYPVVEKFKAPQGEGLFTGTPMAFIRLQGCSVGKTVCHNCDTDFKDIYAWKGGGLFDEQALRLWVDNYRHVCITGGEPFDHDLVHLIRELAADDIKVHIETSGTKFFPEYLESHMRLRDKVHICVSPKPGWRERWISMADEVKVIVGGLGTGEGWPTLETAVNWTESGITVFLQPVNKKNEPDKLTLSHALELIDAYPQLRLSVQLHKYINVR
jgi:7-carboxy-7-deazaguanine synthase